MYLSIRAVDIRNTLSRILLPLAIAALPFVLLYSSLRTFHELDEQRTVYLRQRVSILAARLENLRAGATPESLWETLSENEPYLRDIAIISRGAADDAASLAPIWNGRELFRTELENARGGRFRAYVPFHSNEGLRIARIDLDAGAADFLMVHARHNVIIASLGGLALLVLSMYAMWAMRRAARAQVRQLEFEHLARLGKMAAVMAHEIRNPLGTIKGFVQLARERADSATRALLEPAAAQTERLERLVRDLLAYARPPSPTPAAVDWRELATALAAHGRELIGERPIKLFIASPDFVWRTDAALLEQILLNLLRNAIEAIPAPAPGEVRVDLETNGSGLIISVSDTGVGLSDAAAARIFEPFFTTKPFGTGLGLPTARGLARSLGGDLEIRRRDAGGTSAILRFANAAPAIAGVLT
jgi:two-component system sensor histidine kinase HydH